MNKEVRVRFAPSPTGNLHIGSARTALFNFLFSRFKKGKFILRIEDTDTLRSKKEFEDDILRGLKWLGINWDEGPFYQMDRYKEGVYTQYAEKLLLEGKAYRCFCSEEELEEHRKHCEEKQLPIVYSGKCRNLEPNEIQKKLTDQAPHVIRFKSPPEVVSFYDEVRGEITFDMALQGDLVIIRPDGMPTYNFAVVIDDMEMAITHVVRGEDHISNTPKQIQLFQALGATAPKYAHISMILGPDRAKLSKRHGAKSITEFQNEGFLPEALFNFLALLGWSHPDEKELATSLELGEIYALERVSKSNSIFNFDKLSWLNGQYLRSYPAEKIWQLSKHFLPESEQLAFPEVVWLQIVEATREHLTLLSDIMPQTRVFFADNLVYENLSILKESKLLLDEYSEILRSAVFEVDALTEITNSWVKNKGVKKGALFHGLRYAVTAEEKGLALFKLLAILGKEKVLSRIKEAVSLV